MNSSTNSATSPDHELLVAYLDGELAPEQAQQVERRLSQDERFRGLLRELQATWDLLDDLPQPTLDDGFTRTTVEMVAVRLADDVQLSTLRQTRRHWQRRLVLMASTTACLLLGYFVTRMVQDQPDQQLLQDLPVIENLDAYTQVENVDFLRQLADADLFDEVEEEEASDDTH